MKHHITVLTHEAVDALQIRPGATIVDATFGSGGHAREILSQLKPEGTFVGLDQDKTAVVNADELETEDVTIHLRTGNFRNITQILDELGIQTVDGILADLGWRMEQFESDSSATGVVPAGGKGFSFRSDEPILMTYGDPKEYPFTAEDIVNTWDEEAVRNVIKAYGEERFAGRIARSIVEARNKHPITKAGELSQIVERAVPGFYRRGRIHPATRTFQALRIAVNDELDALRDLIAASVPRLRDGGRLAIISFHSLEDRIVKQQFRDLAKSEKGTVITKKPIQAGKEELESNPRARSAKLRIFEKHEEEH